MTLVWRFAAASDVGLLREGNEDSAYAGPRLLAVADGMGGHAAGEVASAAAIAALQGLDASVNGDTERRLRRAVEAANETLKAMVAADSELSGMGTTVTAAVADGERFLLGHIGDSRAYLLRDGDLEQLTHDHTFVQQLVDEGRIAAADAAHHPHRSVITRALDGRERVDLDVTSYDVHPGDRLLLCSDGLSGVVRDETLREVLAGGEPEDAVQRLVDLALRGGGPDNITVIVADPVLDNDGSAPVYTGAAEAPPPRPEPVRRAKVLRRRRSFVVIGVVLALLATAAMAGRAYVRSQFYVGVDDGRVAIYRGVDGWSSVEETTDLTVDRLPAFLRGDVEDGIAAKDRADARTIVERLRQQAATP